MARMADWQLETAVQQLTERLREGTADEVAERDHVLSVIGDWADGVIDLWAVRRHTDGAQRFTAVQFSSPKHPRWSDLMRCLDALIDSDVSGPDGRCYRTQHGTITEAEMRGTGVWMTKDGRGEVVLHFPGERGVLAK